MSTTPKKTAELKAEERPVETRGVKSAAKNRAACNDLTDEQRNALTLSAMQMIYGKNGSQVPVRRA